MSHEWIENEDEISPDEFERRKATRSRTHHSILEGEVVEINGAFLKKWRETYRWPLHQSRNFSEKKIFELEELVKQNVLNIGSMTVKDVLTEIVKWKTRERFQATKYFLSNKEEEVKRRTYKVLEMLRKEPRKVVEPMRQFTLLDGVKIAVASTFLRFVDPVEHKYGIIDKNVARFLNDQGITHFTLRSKDDYIMYTLKNIREYQNFNSWLMAKIVELNSTTFEDIYGNKRKFTPVDVEMAIFAYKTQCK